MNKPAIISYIPPVMPMQGAVYLWHLLKEHKKATSIPVSSVVSITSSWFFHQIINNETQSF